MYRGSALTADALPNHRVPSLALHRHVDTPAFVSPEQTSDTSIRPPLSACGLRAGTTWSDYYQQFNQLKQKYTVNSFKTLYFLRHAQGTHNEAESYFGTPVWDATESLKEQYHDPDLTEKGMNQCKAFADVLPEALKAGMKPELIIASPLKRTLHTSSLCLKPLYTTLPVVSVELARETLGEHTCDRRSPISEMSERFDGVQFHFIRDDIDPLWTPRRETKEEELIRAQRFLDFLFTLPEDHIILVNHSGMLSALAKLFWKPFNPTEQAPIASFSDAQPKTANVLQYLQADGALSHTGFSSRHCELQPFCVARLPPPSIKLTSPSAIERPLSLSGGRPPVCAVIGVGPGLGRAIAHRFARGGYAVAACARRLEVVKECCTSYVADPKSNSGFIQPFALDSTNEQQIKQVFAEIRRTMGPIRVLIYNAAQRKFRLENVLEVSVATVENFWRVNCLGALLCAREAIPDMLAATGDSTSATAAASSGTTLVSAPLLPPHRGTILFTGATASLRSLAGLSSMSIGKFGLRALGQSLAREFGAKGIHVCHVIVDGAVDSELLRSYVKGQQKKFTTAAETGSGSSSSTSSTSTSARKLDASVPFEDHFLDPNAVAEQYFHLHSQPPSCWTQELDMRPYPEPIYARM